ncbi:MAG: hypothetical protein IH919_11895 [Deltaproteobacteria bacterium]|nr:hypothetical protein [Deltaproteobacteria bacterium]
MGRHMLFFAAFLFFFLQAPGISSGQMSNEVLREAARLEKLATYVWEGLLEESRFGSSVDQRTKLALFNFVNGTRALKLKTESRRARDDDLADFAELLQLQSRAVDSSLRSVRIARIVMRDWDDAKASLDFLTRLVTRTKRPSLRDEDTARSRDNVNNLGIEISEIRSVGNFFKNDYRIRGVISGRNIVSAGIYSEGRLLKPISVRLHDRSLSETAFSVRLDPPEGEVKIRVIDSQGFVLEKPVELPERGLLPGLR